MNGPMPWTLLAELDRRQILNALRDGFGTPARSESMHWLLLAVLAGGALLIVATLAQRRERGKLPRDYLLGVARRLQLSRWEIWTLRRIARRAGLKHPAAMLLSPGSLAHALQLALRAGGGWAVRRRVDSISRKIFGVGLKSEV